MKFNYHEMYVLLDFVEGVVEATDAVAFVDSPVNGVVCVDSADPNNTKNT